ncbi:MAG: MBL fold metallo-hydrolase [Geminicoccaceae bacterium]
MLTRRGFVATSAALSLVPLGGAGALTQVAGAYRRGVGDTVVTALLDGYLELDPNMLTGSDKEANKALLRDAFIATDAVETSVNAYLIQTPNNTVLVDGGAGSAFGPTAGNLPAAIEAAGVAPDDVDTLFCTHLHPDHVGAFIADGEAAFANAELVVHSADQTFWSNDDNFADAGEQAQNFAAIAQSVLSAYQDRLRAVENGVEIVPGVQVMHFPGHTPGHSGLMVSSGDSSMLLWGDIVHIGPVQFARPELTIPFDVNQPKAAETRAGVLDMVAADRIEIAGSHIDFPSFGHVEKAPDGYTFTPSRWDHKI